MKKLILLFSLIAFLAEAKTDTTYTEKTLPDSLIITKTVDDMTEKVYFFPSKSLILKDGKKGFKMSAFISENMKFQELKVVAVDIGTCHKNDQLIIMFNDSTKMTLTMWNDFNCKGYAWFKVTKGQTEDLANKKIIKVKLTNGDDFASFSKEVPEEDQDYYIRLFRMLKKNEFYNLKN